MSGFDLSRYPKVWGADNANTVPLFDGRPIQIQEKIDGSQFTFAVDVEGVLRLRSKGREIYLPVEDKLFRKASEWCDANRDRLVPGLLYRGEAMCSPKHNTLEYQSSPDCGFVLYDVMEPGDIRMDADQAEALAEGLGVPWAPIFFAGTPAGDAPKERKAFAEGFVTRDSVLGGRIEGVVVKPVVPVYDDRTGRLLTAKIVAPDFKEANNLDWKRRHPPGKEVREEIGQSFATGARFQKAVQYLRESGALEGSPRDIGPLLRRLNEDFDEECVGLAKDALWKWAGKLIKKKATAGFPEWYKARLAEEWGDSDSEAAA